MITTTAKRLAELVARSREAHRKAMRRTERQVTANPERPMDVLLAQEDRASELAAAVEALDSLHRNRIASCSPTWSHRALAQVAEHRRAYMALSLELHIA